MQKEYYVTSDIGLVSTLLVLGFSVDAVNVDAEDSRRSNFYFDNTQHLAETVQKFWNRELTVEPNELFAARKELLTRLRREGYVTRTA